MRHKLFNTSLRTLRMLENGKSFLIPLPKLYRARWCHCCQKGQLAGTPIDHIRCVFGDNFKIFLSKVVYKNMYMYCGCLIEWPCQSDSSKYPQNMFLWIINENYTKAHLIFSYVNLTISGCVLDYFYSFQYPGSSSTFQPRKMSPKSAHVMPKSLLRRNSNLGKL